MKLSDDHRNALQDILILRRDVRHFRTDPVPDKIVADLRKSMDFAPSVGNARPWRVVEIVDVDARREIIANFEAANTKAAAIYAGDALTHYNSLKLEGLRSAPLHLAIFTDLTPDAGKGLGRQSMPEMLQYSTVTAIHTLWLAARAHNIGVGWISILDPEGVRAICGVPDTWTLTGYLCAGYAAGEDDTPLLHRNEWQQNTATHWTKL